MTTSEAYDDLLGKLVEATRDYDARGMEREARYPDVRDLFYEVVDQMDEPEREKAAKELFHYCVSVFVGIADAFANFDGNIEIEDVDLERDRYRALEHVLRSYSEIFLRDGV